MKVVEIAVIWLIAAASLAWLGVALLGGVASIVEAAVAFWRGAHID